MHKQTIRVVYPADDGRIVLRTEENWDTNVEPVGQNDCVSKFAIDCRRSADFRADSEIRTQQSR